MSIKKVNLWSFYKRFSKIIFGASANENVIENFIFFGRSKDLPTSKFDDYNWKGSELALYFFFDYLKTIIVIKNKDEKDGDIFFVTNHSNQIF